MHRSISLRRCSIAFALAAALLTWPAAGYAQLGGILPPPPTTTTGTVLGNASAVQATILGMTTVLSGTGSIGSNDALDAYGWRSFDAHCRNAECKRHQLCR